MLNNFEAILILNCTLCRTFTMKSFLLFIPIILSCCEAYKILIVFPMPGKSHSILGNGYVRHLLNDGHEVTYITPFPYKHTSSKLRIIDVSSNFEAFPESIMNITAIMNKDINIQDVRHILPFMLGVAKMTIANENVQNLIYDTNEQFDVVIAEWMFSSLFSGFAAVFDCPLIWASSIYAHFAVLALVDEPSNPSYTAFPLSADLPPFTFFQRAFHFISQTLLMLMKYIYLETVEGWDYSTLLAPAIEKQGRKPPPYSYIQFNASLLFTNSHVSLGQATSIPQSVKAIGGYHMEESLEPLSDDLTKIMNAAKDGVIYFSMGSNLKSKDIPKEVKEDLLKMFIEVKQTVLWKFEEDLPNKPKNVHILKWAPQQSILAHPNTVLFITHGGYLSTIETIHFGVPIIGIPVFADQFLNVAAAVKNGYALKVDLSMTMARDLKLAVEEIITNSKYTQRAKQLSLVYHDRPVPPGKELLHWVQHVIKTRGALHLRSPALHVPFYQKLYLDLFAVILIVLFIVQRILKYLFKTFSSKTGIDKMKKSK